MVKEYKSVEQRLWDWSELVRYDTQFGTRVFYGVIAGALRTPTTLRKMANGQGIYHEGFEDSIGKIIGVTIGAIGVLGGLVYSMAEAINGNYIPLEVISATTVASGLFELGRLPRSRQENLEMKAQKAQKFAQELKGPNAQPQPE